MLTITAGIIANNLFLVKYYQNQVQEYIKDTYDTMATYIVNGDITNENSSKLDSISYDSNLNVLVINPNGVTIYCSAMNITPIRNRLNDYLYFRNPNFNTDINDDAKSAKYNAGFHYKVIEHTKDYELIQSYNIRKSELIEMYGTLNDGSKFIIQTTINGIIESIKITNQFYLYVLFFITVISIILIYFSAKQFSKPIKKLTVLSSQMANLDFDVKYEKEGVDELDILGQNFNDMSEKLKETIDNLKQANEQLLEDIHKQELTNKMQSDFISNVSHELKTPIALIQGYAEGLTEDSICSDNESRKYYADIIVDESKKMSALVKDLLCLQAMEYGDSIVLSKFDLINLIKELLSNYSKVNDEVKITYNGVDSFEVTSDAYKIEQVLINYINNACNHTIDNSIIIKSSYNYKLAFDDIKSRYENIPDDIFVVSIYNKCSGIPDEDKDNIWNKFYKVDKAHTREYGGTGIGLSIVKAIMDTLKGYYGFFNTNDGVEFYFAFKIDK